MTHGPLLHVEDLSAGYRQITVLRDISLKVGEAEIVVLLGANGAGKTTLLRAVSGLIPSTGTVRLGSQSLAGTSPETRARTGIAHVPQGRGTFTQMTVEENLRIGAFARKDREVGEDIEHWLRFFPKLGERRRQIAGNMSGGEQQMLAVARALMSRPKLMLLDEPSLGLAPILTQDLFEQLQRLNVDRGLALLVVEQAAHLALGVAHRAYTLTSGTISKSRDATDMADPDVLRRAYLGSSGPAGASVECTTVEGTC